jgi:hypothetical protein
MKWYPRDQASWLLVLARAVSSVLSEVGGDWLGLFPQGATGHQDFPVSCTCFFAYMCTMCIKNEWGIGMSGTAR